MINQDQAWYLLSQICIQWMTRKYTKESNRVPSPFHHPSRIPHPTSPTPKTFKLAPLLNHNRLTSPHLGSRHSIRLGVVPLVERNTRVRSTISTGELDSRARSTSSTALDLELVALDVELCLADMTLV